ncbi:molybdate ABC transporter permease subunit [Bacillota bacterium Meth-B3]|nr:molybdate ABC transporter permease subunit [Christensenellaceae bacterium]
MNPLFVSLRTALTSGAITFALGLIAAKAVHGIRSARVKRALDVFATLPMVLPPTVAGFLLLMVFGVNRPVGRFFQEAFGVKVAFSWGATVISAVFISFPLMYRAARGALEQLDPALSQAARTIGMSELKLFLRVELKLALPGVLAGGALSFARGLGEFGATAMLAGNILGRTRTLPLAVYSAVAAGDMAEAARYVWVLLGISVVCAFAVEMIGAKGGRTNA